MAEKTPPPGKSNKGSVPARGNNAHSPVDPSLETLHGFDAVATGSPSAPSAGETNTHAGAATLKPAGPAANSGGGAGKYGGGTMVPHDPAPVLAVRPVNLDQTSPGQAGPVGQKIGRAS